MKNKLPILFPFILAFCMLLTPQKAQSQIWVKAGLGYTIVYDRFLEDLHLMWGGEISLQLPLSQRLSFETAANLFLGTQESFHDPDVFQHELLVGIRPSLRYHLFDHSDGAYIGVGGEMKHLRIANFFSEPDQTLVGWEYNFGLTAGSNMLTKNGRLVVPFGYVGFALREWDVQYPFVLHIGLSYSLNRHNLD